MDRRTFALLAAGMGLGWTRCTNDELPTATTDDDEVPRPPRSWDTAADRAYGVVDGLIERAEPVPEGVRWSVIGNGDDRYPADLYTGQAGILVFLSEAYRVRPSSELATVLEDGGRWLESRPASWSQGLYDGAAGRAWAYLSLHDALGATSDRWLRAALALAPGIAGTTRGLPGDLISGHPGQGLLLLRLFELTGDPRWRDAARSMADVMLSTAVSSGSGVKYPSFTLGTGETVFYTGMSHGAAGAGYFLCRLADVLSTESERRLYIDGGRAVARWLSGIAEREGPRVNWYRREPDQMNQRQVQWCHGAPGIGMFHAELHRITGEAEYLETALSCAAHVDAFGGQHGFSCQCHGVAGNAQLYLKLFRQTGDASWLSRARDFGQIVWSRRLAGQYYPAWIAGDGSNRNNPGLMTGVAGVGWFWLQMASDGTMPGPVTT